MIGPNLVIDHEYVSSSRNVADTETITFSRGESAATATVHILGLGQGSATYVFFNPFVRLSTSGIGPFIEAGLGVGPLSNSNFTISRTVLGNVGQTDQGPGEARFQNGGKTETLMSGEIPSVNKLRASINAAVGYQIVLPIGLSLLPKAVIDVPLTTVAPDSQKYSNRKISSYAVVLGSQNQL